MSTPELKQAVKALIVRALMLEEVAPQDIEDDAPLFGEGLGLDSVDALELAVEIERTFGVSVPEGQASRPLFRSVSTLAEFLARSGVSVT